MPRVQENAVLSHSRLNVCSGKFGNIVPRSRHSALPPQCGATGQAPRLGLLKKRWARLPPTPRSADRARSLARVSEKREYFKCRPETIGDFAPKLFKLGV